MKIGEYGQIARALGPAALARNFLHRAKKTAGWYALRRPVTEWPEPGEAERHGHSPFTTPAPSAFNTISVDAQKVAESAERVLRGEMLYFSWRWLPRPPSWRANPLNQYEMPEGHWSSRGEFSESQGDIKWIWEPSRFDWVYLLGRAWGLTGDSRYAEGFLGLLDEWRAHNKPFSCPNFMCGQESSFRLFALAWAAGIFGEYLSNDPARRAMLFSTISVHARRVESAFGYALSQNNNHGLAEAAALYVAGHSLPSAPEAARWRRRGKRHLVKLILSQFSGDGGYIQHSLNYHRLALRILFIALYYARAYQDRFPNAVYEQARAATRFLTDTLNTDGCAPNYGANDGANIFSLNGCGYRDFRPAIQPLTYLLDGTRRFGPGAHDEELVWHFGPQALSAPLSNVPPGRLIAREAGYYVIRGASTHALVRLHTYKTRPSHADTLALDLWRNGVNIITDAGTYLYYADGGLYDFLKSTAAHSVVEVNGKSQMRPWRRFLWSGWTRTKLLHCEDTATGGFDWQGEHYGYENDGVVHRRRILLEGDDWLVIDDLYVSREPARLALRWRLGGAQDWRLQRRSAESERLQTSIEIATRDADTLILARGERGYPETAESHYYGEVHPVAVLRAELTASSPARWITTIGAPGLLRVDGLRAYWKHIALDLRCA